MVDEALLLGVELSRSSVSQEVRKAHNRIQGGPQLVAHTGEKLALQSGCVFDFTVAELALGFATLHVFWRVEAGEMASYDFIGLIALNAFRPLIPTGNLS